MKIITKEKDYYDYVSHLFGGGDPKIILNRTKFEIPKELYISENIIKYKLDLPYTPYSNNIEYGWLVLLGKLYLVYYCKENQGWKLAVNNEKFLDSILKRRSFLHPITINDIYDYKLDLSIDLCKALNKPYFIIKQIYGNLTTLYKMHKTTRVLHLSKVWPNLGNLGFTKLISPEQMYQDISLFMGQYLHNPEVVNISDNNVKIENHGFDLKTSFRPNIK